MCRYLRRFSILPILIILLFSTGCATQSKDHGLLSDELQKLIIKDQCSDLMLSYTKAIDETNVDSMMVLYSPDGSWGMTNGFKVEGEESLIKFWRNMFGKKRSTLGRHILTNLHFTELNASSAKATANITAYRYTAGKPDSQVNLSPQLLVALDIQFIYFDQGWRLQKVTIDPLQLDSYDHNK